MKTVRIGNVILGEGIPKICVSIIEKTRERIIGRVLAFDAGTVDIAEWRLDWFDGSGEVDEVLETAAELRGRLGDIPLLATFRTAGEGGEKALDPEHYKGLVLAVIRSGYADMVDVELSAGEAVVKELTAEAHQNDVKVMLSSHDFEKTPDVSEMVSCLCKMQDLDGDILKVAVTPNSKQDVVNLLTATAEMYDHYADRPMVTVSMKGLGAVSRIAGEVFGSAMTFGTIGKASASGQIEVQELKRMLSVLHKSLSAE